MRIAIDAQQLTGRPTGVGRYLSELLSAWSRLPAAAAHQFILCAPEPIEPSWAPGLPCSISTAPGRGTAWQQVTLPRLVKAARPDVLLAPAYSGPLLSRAPMVLSVHDVSFFAHAEWFGWREGLRRRLLTRLSARRAARVLACSDFSKQEISRYLHVDADRIDVIYLGVTSIAHEPSTEPERRAADGEPLVLFVGSLLNRRHVPEIIDGFARLAARMPAQLEIVGENRTMPRQDIDALIAASPAAGKMRARSYVSDQQLAGLYRRASAFVFLSDYEGFGMTPVEALAAGVPILVLDTPVSREIYGPAALYIERPDPRLIEQALERLLVDVAERNRVMSAASSVLQRYSWEECARRTLQALLSSAS